MLLPHYFSCAFSNDRYVPAVTWSETIQFNFPIPLRRMDKRRRLNLDPIREIAQALCLPKAGGGGGLWVKERRVTNSTKVYIPLCQRASGALVCICAAWARVCLGLFISAQMIVCRRAGVTCFFLCSPFFEHHIMLSVPYNIALPTRPAFTV